MGKNIIVLSDGTAQEGGKGNNTNIYKLFNMLLDRTDEQVVFYDPGLGTGINKITGKTSGAGISKNLKQCYEFIFDNFQSGDNIYLIGFSRGAATVRSLSNFIHHFGILPKSRPDLINDAYRIYKKHESKKKSHNEQESELEKAANKFIEKHHTMWTRIRFIGCFDTVAALGSPFPRFNAILNRVPFLKSSFHNFSLSKSVENAYQALSIDDERKTFHPLLWNTNKEDYQTIHQVWFSGMHTDVGGGYAEQKLSDIALEWMIEKAITCGIKIYSEHKVEISPNPFGKMHDSRGGRMKKLFRKEIRYWPEKRNDKPVIHKSVFERYENKKSKLKESYDPWIFKEDYEIED